MSTENIPNTVRESIDICRMKLEEEGYSQWSQPYDNHPFRMNGKTEEIRDALVSSGMFEVRDKGISRGTYVLRNLNHGTKINLETNFFDDIEEIQEEIAKGWVYSTIHFGSEFKDEEIGQGLAEDGKIDLTPFLKFLKTIEDLLSVAEVNRIPMKTIHKQNRKRHEVGYDPD